MKENKKLYWIDFESWQIEADNRNDAYRLAFYRLMKGGFPEILSVEVSQKPSLKEFDEFMKNNSN